MKGDDRMLAVLNELLTDELTACNQYMLHAEVCEHWGYDKLHDAIQKQAIDEMRHAEWLIQRILFLDGQPIVSQLDPMRIGKTVVDIIANDLAAEMEAVPAYNAGIRLGHEVDDQGTVDLLTKILGMEEGHIDWAEKQQDQIAQMGLEHYLAQQTTGAA